MPHSQLGILLGYLRSSCQGLPPFRQKLLADDQECNAVSLRFDHACAKKRLKKVQKNKLKSEKCSILK